jgi:hypothetical protein
MAKTKKKSAAVRRAGAARAVVRRGPSRSARFVYFFGNGKADGDRSMRDTLGGKGAGLAEMTNAGLPVPPGFTISTDVCSLYYKQKGRIPPGVEAEIAANSKKPRGRRSDRPRIRCWCRSDRVRSSRCPG